MAQNPFQDSQQSVRRERGNFALGIAEVVAVPDDAEHQIAIQPATKTGPSETVTSPSSATVMVAHKPEIALPEVGDLVIFGRFKNRQNVVLGTIYSQQSSISDYGAADRTIASADGSASITLSDGGIVMDGPFGVVPKLSSDPSGAPEGSVWYRDDLDEYRGVEGGQTVSFDTTPV